MAEADPTTPEGYQFFDPQNLACPHAGWKMLREKAPVYRIPVPAKVPVYVAAGRDEIEFITRNNDHFSTRPDASVWRWGDGFPDEIAEAFAAAGMNVVMTLQSTDPPDSLHYRNVLSEVIGPGSVKNWRPRIEEIIEGLIADIPDGEPFNFVEAFSVPLPLKVICLILGIPYSDSAFFRYYSDEFTHLVDPTHPMDRALKATDTIVKGYAYLRERMLEYRENPADNLLSAYANAEFDGRLATMDEALSMAHVTIIAGNETTRNALSSALFTLAKDPDLWARLKADRSLVKDFYTEVLRRDAPATTTPRTVLKDVELGGVQLRKGDVVFVLWGSGSHAEQHFDDPLAFDIDRSNKSAHTTFGMGVHHCAGSALAREELGQAFNAILDNFDRIELARPAEDISYDPVFGFRAISELPVIFHRSSRA
ncbi:cytochrome P450 [Novosphingobium marinum]|uniref:Cytochrome P450 n=1 Tax=Novosphingobium marinum TaxID=1514948 RepID=A0A7Z0BTF8_9SPHN|nr:cytochrome P450 [Novosphingobium marinum]NYH94038.1 cytochrome P450 [Novosphingobium marinum]GGC19131.1 cytochrome P450 [Novosphingobium marinum]